MHRRSDAASAPAKAQQQPHLKGKEGKEGKKRREKRTEVR